jgi:amidase
MTWESVSSAKRRALLHSIPSKWRLKESEIPPISRLRDVLNFVCRCLNSQEIEITQSSPITILEKIRTGEWSTVEVILAFSHRASLAHQLVCVISI